MRISFSVSRIRSSAREMLTDRTASPAAVTNRAVLNMGDVSGRANGRARGLTRPGLMTPRYGGRCKIATSGAGGGSSASENGRRAPGVGKREHLLKNRQAEFNPAPGRQLRRAGR